MLNILYDKPGFKTTETMQNVSRGDGFSSVAVRKGSQNDQLCSGPPFIHRMCTRVHKMSEFTKTDLDRCGKNNQALRQV